MATLTAPVRLPVRRFGETARRDTWWIYPLVVFLGLSGLRALQTETGSTFTDDWSWVPYVIMVVVLVLGGALVWLLRTAAHAEKEVR